MKIQFSSNQQYQLDAIHSVVDLFDGQPLAGGPFEFRFESLTGHLRRYYKISRLFSTETKLPRALSWNP